MNTEARPKKLFEQASTEHVERVDDTIRLMHYSPRTGETCTQAFL